ncbi:hypothetical protein D3C80_1855170 [compost metagenome]
MDRAAFAVRQTPSQLGRSAGFLRLDDHSGLHPPHPSQYAAPYAATQRPVLGNLDRSEP